MSEVAIETELRDLIEGEFGFGERTADDYVAELQPPIRKELKDDYGWRPHPRHGKTWVSPDNYDELTE